MVNMKRSILILILCLFYGIGNSQSSKATVINKGDLVVDSLLLNLSQYFEFYQNQISNAQNSKKFRLPFFCGSWSCTPQDLIKLKETNIIRLLLTLNRVRYRFL